MSEDPFSAVRGAAPVALGIEEPSVSKPLFYVRGDHVFRRPEQTGPGTYSLGGPIAEADNPAAAAEIARRLNAHDELLAALRLATTACFVVCAHFGVDPDDITIRVTANGGVESREMLAINVGDVISRAGAAIAAAEGRADG